MDTITVYVETPHASVVLLTPSGPDALAWLEANVEPGAVRLGRSLGVETRYVGPILLGACEAGFLVSVVPG